MFLKCLKEIFKVWEISMNLIVGGFDFCFVLCMLIVEFILNVLLCDWFFMIGGDLWKFFLVKNYEVLYVLIIYRCI